MVTNATMADELQDFEDAIASPTRAPFAQPDRYDVVDPEVAGRGGLKERRNAEGILRRLYLLAGGDASRDLRTAVADTSIGHDDQRAIIGVQEHSNILLIGSVTSGQEQIGASMRMDPAPEPL